MTIGRSLEIQKVSDKDLLIAITKVFRAKGYESTREEGLLLLEVYCK
jgi:hypothetical protein